MPLRIMNFMTLAIGHRYGFLTRSSKGVSDYLHGNAGKP